MSESNQAAATGPDFSRAGGLLPAIAQDAESGEVLMLAYMNAESYAETLATGHAVYYSRSRKKLWRKGEQSGNVQRSAPSISIATATRFCFKSTKWAAPPATKDTRAVFIGG